MLAGYPFRHWSVTSSRTVLANRVLKVRQDTCVIPASGGALEYFVLELADWVNVATFNAEVRDCIGHPPGIAPLFVGANPPCRSKVPTLLVTNLTYLRRLSLSWTF